MDHATLSPSSSSRWMTCPGSVTLVAQLAELLGTDDTPSDPALKGTAMHHIAEQTLLGNELTADDLKWTDAAGNHRVISQADITECVDPYVEFVQNLGGELMVESRLVVNDEVWGTGDALVIVGDTLYIVDLKTGHGVVYAKDNTQLKLYALGALKELDILYDIKNIETVISQGRTGHHDSQVYSADEIWAFDEEVNQAIDRINTETDNYVVSDKGCQWCPARAHCPAMHEHTVAAAKLDFKQMKLDELGEAMARLPVLKAFIKGVEDQVKQHLEKGNQVAGYKMVEGRKSARKWADEEEAIKYFRNRVSKFQHTCYNMKFMTPTQLEKALKAEDVKIRGKVDFTKVVAEQKGGAPTIVPESDEREALVYGDKAAADFAGCDDDLLE